MNRILASLIVVCATSFGTAGSAAPITYNFGYSIYGVRGGPDEVAGSITTDGTLGVISASDITSWTWTPGPPFIVYSSTDAGAGLTLNGDLYATDTALYFVVPPAPGYPQTASGSLALNPAPAGNPYAQATLEFDWTETWLAPFSPGNPSSSALLQYWYGALFQSTLPSGSGESNFGLATPFAPSLQQITPIPEPSTLILAALGGLVLLVGRWRR